MGKRARGEAVVAAWSRVVLVIVGGSKVKLHYTTQDCIAYIPLNAGDGGGGHDKRGESPL